MLFIFVVWLLCGWFVFVCVIVFVWLVVYVVLIDDVCVEVVCGGGVDCFVIVMLVFVGVVVLVILVGDMLSVVSVIV